jgi:polyisoprenoid-binding protein YceI
MSTTLNSTKIEAGTWSLDPVHSSATFRVKHFGLTWLRGSFPSFELEAKVADDGSVALEGGTAVEGINFANPQLHGHLMSPDFFDAELNPRLGFTSSDVRLNDDGTAVVSGELTMRGTTKSIELTGTWSPPLEGLGGDIRFGLELAGELDRTDYGISWAATLPNGADVLGRTVRIEGEFELVQG